MIYFISAKHDEEVLKTYLLPSITNIRAELYLVEGPENIYEKYNIGINKLVEKGLSDTDIVCFVHSDVKILDPFFQDKINYIFSSKHDVGLCGVIGTKELLENGSWWINASEKQFGHIIQENENKVYHLVKGGVGYCEDMVIVDGLFLSVKGELIKKGLRFDESFKSFHLYDLTFCFQVLEMGYKIACVDILLQHKSTGLGFLTKDWIEMRDKFVNNIKSKGYNFPLTKDSFNKFIQKRYELSASSDLVFSDESNF